MAAKMLKDDREEIEDGEYIEGERPENVTKLLDDIDMQLSAVTSEFTADDRDVNLKIKVYKIIPQTGRAGYLLTCTPHELPIMDRLRDEYGAGNYEVRVYRNGKLARKLVESIIAPEKKPEPSQNDVAAILKSIEKLAERPSAAAAPADAGNPVQIAIAMMTAMASVMAQMRETFQPPRPAALAPAAEQKDPMDYLIKGIELANELRGDGGTGSTVMDVLRDGVKALGPHLGTLAANAQANGAPPGMLPTAPGPGAPIPRHLPTMPSGAMPPPPGPVPGVTPQEGPPMFAGIQNAMFRKYVAMLVDKAAADADPALYAELILDNAPFELIEGFLQRPELAAELARFDPRVLQFRAWFGELETSLRQMIADAMAEQNPAGVPANPAGAEIHSAPFDPAGTPVAPDTESPDAAERDPTDHAA